MTVATWQTPAFQTQTGTTYKTALDNAIVTGERITRAFAPHAKTAPDMNVVFDAGYVLADQVLIEIAQQTISAGAAPGALPRIDRYVIDRLTGVITRVAGTEAGSPVAPSIPEEKNPCCQVLMTVGMTTVTNAIITDERLGGGGAGGAVVKHKTGSSIIITTTAETDVFSLTLGAGSLATNNVYWTTLEVSDMDIDPGETLTFRLKLGATTMLSMVVAPGPCVGLVSGVDRVEIFLRARNSATLQLASMTGSHFTVPYAFGTASENSALALTYRLTAQFSGGARNLDVGAALTVKFS